MRNYLLPHLLYLAIASALTTAGAEPVRSRAEMEPATRLQIFLDEAEFGPGKIDGRYGEFTDRALRLYRQAHGMPPLNPLPGATPPASGAKPKAASLPELSDLDLSAINPVFTTYTISADDEKQVGSLPESIAEQAKLKWLPYRTLAEAVAEKFHCDRDFLTELNPGIDLLKIKAGDQVTVPNVQPFDVAALKEEFEEEAAKKGSNDVDDKDTGRENANGKKGSTPPPPQTVTILVDTTTNMLQVRDQGKLVAAYPVTVGSAHTESPIGEWQVRKAYMLPHFRYDEQMLNHGERSDDFHILAPGPNNPVGVVWIALNKKGIGLHGTNDPDSIGRAASHGCIRLANWDAVRLAARVEPKMHVSIGAENASVQKQ